MRRVSIILFLLIIPFHFLSARGNYEEQKKNVSQFNEALSLYRNRQYEESSDLLENLFFREEDQEINKLLLQSANHFRIAENSVEETNDLTGAVQRLDDSIGLLKRVLEFDKENTIAANNLEVAMTLKEEWMQQKEEQNPSQDSQQPEQTQKDEAEKLQKEQQQMADDNNKESENHQDAQEELRKRTENLKDHTEQGSPERQSLENAVDAQEKAEQALEEGNSAAAREQQNEAAQHLADAVRNLSQGSEEDTSGYNENETDSAGDQLIQSIIDNELNRDENSENTGNGIAVERNW
ncbi:DUF4175 family protein [Spirochaeta isovalerica]|uniref:Outer membrane biosynthesis protein TonB n=1 Tax=Spirochaeta isovalerica TaxID=150 RepID=A0A841R701_9SPIO|nr:DUF4175 family protein [Spirochaeta isovalerica]MBB6478759.1 outer membrane biosynthesis protein TonB [Spirochaeta isovalerica]